MSLFIVSAILVGAASLFQSSGLAAIGIVKLNLALASVTVLSTIHEKWVGRWILILLSVFILKFSPVIGWFDVILAATLFLAILLADYLPWKRVINVSVAVFTGTVILNIESFDFGTFVLEVSMNVVFAILLLWLAELTYARK